MATWWARALGLQVEADARRVSVSVEATGLVTAWEFMRPSPNDYHLPDQVSEAKARALLESALTPEQRRDLFTKRCFYVKGKRLTYRIREGHSGNVDALDSKGRVISRFCAIRSAAFRFTT